MRQRNSAIVLLVLVALATVTFAFSTQSFVPLGIAGCTALGSYAIGKFNGYRAGWTDRHNGSTEEERAAWRARQ